LRVCKPFTGRTETAQVGPEVEIGGMDKSQRHLFLQPLLY